MYMLRGRRSQAKWGNLIEKWKAWLKSIEICWYQVKLRALCIYTVCDCTTRRTYMNIAYVQQQHSLWMVCDSWYHCLIFSTKRGAAVYGLVAILAPQFFAAISVPIILTRAYTHTKRVIFARKSDTEILSVYMYMRECNVRHTPSKKKVLKTTKKCCKRNTTNHFQKFSVYQFATRHLRCVCTLKNRSQVDFEAVSAKPWLEQVIEFRSISLQVNETSFRVWRGLRRIMWKIINIWKPKN